MPGTPRLRRRLSRTPRLSSIHWPLPLRLPGDLADDPPGCSERPLDRRLDLFELVERRVGRRLGFLGALEVYSVERVYCLLGDLKERGWGTENVIGALS